MIGRRVAFRFLWPVLLPSALLLGLCTLTAVRLFQQRAGMSESLKENIASRRVAADLEEDLVTLNGLLNEHVEEVGTLHGRIEGHLIEIDQFADQEEEQRLAKIARDAYARYHEGWMRLPPRSAPEHEEAVHGLMKILETEAVPSTQALESYNSRQIEESAEEHRKGLRFLAWGMVIVGSAGAGAGLLFGYGATQAVARSVRRMQIHVRDAAGKLGQRFPEIVFTQEGTLDQLQEEMASLVGQVEDVVQKLQQREREVLRAEQLSAVGQLAAGVAHEIRNPLTSIKMLVQLAQQDGPRLSPDDLEVIEREVRRMERSLNTFLEFARPPKPNREWIELRALVEHTLSLTRGRASKQHIQVKFDSPGRAVEYHGDPEQFQQVMVNLVLNALDAMPGGGTLELHLARLIDGRIELSVADSGQGISAEVMPRLFQPFVSNKETGLGLGLVTTRRIVEDHGGTITAVNRPEGGARFTIRLPKSGLT